MHNWHFRNRSFARRSAVQTRPRLCYLGAMDFALDFWELAAGFGQFLLGLHFVERALKDLAGSAFKRFLRDNTEKPLRAVCTGTLITAVLQSSSVVTLMLLAFVGAGVITLQNALGVVIGSNLGTTFTGWIVAALGFELKIDRAALPAVAAGSVAFVLARSRRTREAARFLLGFGLLFLGLAYMKTSIGSLAASFDVEQLRALGPYHLFFVGLVLTALIQSSSASMVITLTALTSGIVSLEGAAGMVIGSDLGTTGTALLGSVGGTAPKKRVALSHFIFNLVSAVFALALIAPLLWVPRQGLGLQSPAMTLVFFHSSFNLLGIILFLPLLPAFADFLERRFAGSEPTHVNRFIEHVSPSVPEQAVESLESEVRSMLMRVLHFNLSCFGIRDVLFRAFEEESKLPAYLRAGDYEERYLRLKQLQGEIVEFFLKVENQELTQDMSRRIHSLILAVRHAAIAAKGVKDIAHDLADFHRSIADSVIAAHGSIVQAARDLYLRLDAVLFASGESAVAEELGSIERLNVQHYEKLLHEIYLRLQKQTLSELEASTLLNVSNEVYNSNRALIVALKELLLPEDGLEPVSA